MSDLYIVATPIGNLEDITLRALNTLKEVNFIAAEDTRHTKRLLDKYDIKTPSISYHSHSGDAKINLVIERIKKGESAALVSDAGTPCVSDPGFKLVKMAAQAGIKIIPIPGVSAITTLVSASGFPTDTFTFHGFLPHKKGRQTLIKSFKETEHCQIVYESVHRFPKLLKELTEFVGADRSICVGRELTKMHEEIWRGTVIEALEHFNESNTKGEFVVIVAPEKFCYTKA
ncbi:16S rRNA (cytidine(1402)-2'-O)-methyltransferase [bacterium]|nr:16S rRNA (cytidine(1402)-2'-O)-methyltransferase [bacterium]NCQ55595.1 16S rRNA (cytidine(1402)-2'-O)-methyltransferase [Candidatus Parcubacteria bacterium]NCS67420.1 16S rRNA (cytidine(1402)-2'-O)-methyltransferase [Candidatus Peregrinibacteria bacterium]NCS96146.1 16S rRNA (cytidine(1402)-2'-O)-methyltransferase [bacterium]